MRLVIQRVKSASLSVENNYSTRINEGLICYVAFSSTDSTSDYEWSINKLSKMKIFKNNMSLIEKSGELLIVSQFTLFASLKKGNRPSFSKAANPALAKKLYNDFLTLCTEKLNTTNIKTGIFGAHMLVESINDGPFTLSLDTKQRE
ncbi:MAG: D-tyrosyl-tRNA(Tyr) deacylase [Flavobacteriales bacterium TMED191]|nr:MAG: D-tyrosyl-tRNA(Tyr) deacylase [Flavobacteriales bacterium TMED191]|tara:strand:- start:1370 stop:1810 length:441 start_codon:yes stop_codon:yes gene_type:complete